MIKGKTSALSNRPMTGKLHRKIPVEWETTGRRLKTQALSEEHNVPTKVGRRTNSERQCNLKSSSQIVLATGFLTILYSSSTPNQKHHRAKDTSAPLEVMRSGLPVEFFLYSHLSYYTLASWDARVHRYRRDVYGI